MRALAYAAYNPGKMKVPRAQLFEERLAPKMLQYGAASVSSSSSSSAASASTSFSARPLTAPSTPSVLLPVVCAEVLDRVPAAASKDKGLALAWLDGRRSGDQAVSQVVERLRKARLEAVVATWANAYFTPPPPAAACTVRYFLVPRGSGGGGAGRGLGAGEEDGEEGEEVKEDSDDDDDNDDDEGEMVLGKAFSTGVGSSSSSSSSSGGGGMRLALRHAAVTNSAVYDHAPYLRRARERFFSTHGTAVRAASKAASLEQVEAWKFVNYRVNRDPMTVRYRTNGLRTEVTYS